MTDSRGRHLYKITYQDGEVGPYSVSLWADSPEHAGERFYENPDDSDGWEIVKIERHAKRS